LVKEDLSMDYDGLLELVKRRRSIRSFKPDPVPDEYIQKIIDVALWAPSGADSQPWEFIVIKDKENRDKVCRVLAEFQPIIRKLELTREEEVRHPAIATPSGPPGFLTAPVFIIICGDTRFMDLYPMSGVSIESQAEFTFTSDLANAFLYMHLAAASLGLGSQWLTATAQPYAQVLLKDLLGIPKELKIYDTMVLGYPAMQPKPRAIRKREEVVHHERYDRSKFRTEAQVRSYIKNVRQAQRR
jgi:nitroreductase